MWTYALGHVQIYLLVLLRMAAFVGSSPVFSMRVWPTWSKVGLAGALALWVTPMVGTHTIPSITAAPGQFFIIALQETLVGLLMGFFATVMFAVVTMAGQLFDIQIGFSMSTVFDPSQGQSTGLSSTFESLLFTLYFLGMNGLDGALLMVMNSYHLIGLGHFLWPSNTWQVLSKLLGTAMVVSVQLAAPLLTALLLTDVTFAFLSRAVPQMNVYVVSLPAKLFVGLVMFATAMPGMVWLFGRVFTEMFQETDTLMKWLGG